MLPEVSADGHDAARHDRSPHHRYTSFRVRGRIYATAPMEGGPLHVFVDEEDRDRMVVLYPRTYEKLGWGRKIVGLRVNLDKARPDDVGRCFALPGNENWAS